MTESGPREWLQKLIHHTTEFSSSSRDRKGSRTQQFCRRSPPNLGQVQNEAFLYAGRSFHFAGIIFLLWLVCLFGVWGGAIGATLQPFGNLATVRTRQFGAAFCVDHGPFCLDWDCLASAKNLSQPTDLSENGAVFLGASYLAKCYGVLRIGSW